MASLALSNKVDDLLHREADIAVRMIRPTQDAYQFPMISRTALAFRADSDLAQLGAIRAGFGIGVCQSALAKQDKALVRVLPSSFSPTMDTWVAMHEDLRESARCSVTFAAIVAGLKAYIQPS